MTTALTTRSSTSLIKKVHADIFGTESKRKVKRTKKRRKSRSRKEKWFRPKIHSGWKKSQPVATRRRLVLQAHGGDLLSAARSKIALANVTEDSETRVKAKEDARYFLELYHKEK